MAKKFYPTNKREPMSIYFVMDDMQPGVMVVREATAKEQAEMKNPSHEVGMNMVLTFYCNFGDGVRAMHFLLPPTQNCDFNTLISIIDTYLEVHTQDSHPSDKSHLN